MYDTEPGRGHKTEVEVTSDGQCTKFQPINSRALIRAVLYWVEDFKCEFVSSLVRYVH